jgi:hypothetical protein
METRVARILSDTMVVLAAGEDVGVKAGMKFVIIERGPEIVDPRTHASLGSLEIVKGRVVVSHVMGKMCVARTETRTVQVVFSLGEREVADKLNIESADEEFAKAKVVRVGDAARSVE